MEREEEWNDGGDRRETICMRERESRKESGNWKKKMRNKKY